MGGFEVAAAIGVGSLQGGDRYGSRSSRAVVCTTIHRAPSSCQRQWSETRWEAWAEWMASDDDLIWLGRPNTEAITPAACIPRAHSPPTCQHPVLRSRTPAIGNHHRQQVLHLRHDNGAIVVQTPDARGWPCRTAPKSVVACWPVLAVGSVNSR